MVSKESGNSCVVFAAAFRIINCYTEYIIAPHEWVRHRTWLWRLPPYLTITII